MSQKSGIAGRAKKAIDVTVVLTGQEPIDGRAFITPGDRLIDLLNDGRSFIPIAIGEEETLLVAKLQIVSITERVAIEEEEPAAATDEASKEDEKNADDDAAAEEEKATDENGQENPGEKEHAPRPRAPKYFDPYAALRVDPNASLEEIRNAYKTRIKSVHPDSIARLDLDEDLAKAAVQATQRVNYAYKKILAERQARDDIAKADRKAREKDRAPEQNDDGEEADAETKSA
ncbi:MAG: J domain-containing protein [Pseudomonadota bacterium]